MAHVLAQHVGLQVDPDRRGLRSPRVVAASVCGIRATSKKPSWPGSTTVSETPSTATEPFGTSRSAIQSSTGAGDVQAHVVASRALMRRAPLRCRRRGPARCDRRDGREAGSARSHVQPVALSLGAERGQRQRLGDGLEEQPLGRRRATTVRQQPSSATLSPRRTPSASAPTSRPRVDARSPSPAELRGWWQRPR